MRESNANQSDCSSLEHSKLHDTRHALLQKSESIFYYSFLDMEIDEIFNKIDALEQSVRKPKNSLLAEILRKKRDEIPNSIKKSNPIQSLFYIKRFLLIVEKDSAEFSELAYKINEDSGQIIQLDKWIDYYNQYASYLIIYHLQLCNSILESLHDKSDLNYQSIRALLKKEVQHLSKILELQVPSRVKPLLILRLSTNEIMDKGDLLIFFVNFGRHFLAYSLEKNDFINYELSETILYWPDLNCDENNRLVGAFFSQKRKIDVFIVESNEKNFCKLFESSSDLNPSSLKMIKQIVFTNGLKKNNNDTFLDKYLSKLLAVGKKEKSKFISIAALSELTDYRKESELEKLESISMVNNQFERSIFQLLKEDGILGYTQPINAFSKDSSRLISYFMYQKRGVFYFQDGSCSTLTETNCAVNSAHLFHRIFLGFFKKYNPNPLLLESNDKKSDRNEKKGFKKISVTIIADNKVELSYEGNNACFSVSEDTRTRSKIHSLVSNRIDCYACDLLDYTFLIQPLGNMAILYIFDRLSFSLGKILTVDIEKIIGFENILLRKSKVLYRSGNFYLQLNISNSKSNFYIVFKIDRKGESLVWMNLVEDEKLLKDKIQSYNQTMLLSNKKNGDKELLLARHQKFSNAIRKDIRSSHYDIISTWSYQSNSYLFLYNVKKKLLIVLAFNGSSDLIGVHEDAAFYTDSSIQSVYPLEGNNIALYDSKKHILLFFRVHFIRSKEYKLSKIQLELSKEYYLDIRSPYSSYRLYYFGSNEGKNQIFLVESGKQFVFSAKLYRPRLTLGSVEYISYKDIIDPSGENCKNIFPLVIDEKQYFLMVRKESYSGYDIKSYATDQKKLEKSFYFYKKQGCEKIFLLVVHEEGITETLDFTDLDKEGLSEGFKWREEDDKGNQCGQIELNSALINLIASNCLHAPYTYLILPCEDYNKKKEDQSLKVRGNFLPFCVDDISYSSEYKYQEKFQTYCSGYILENIIFFKDAESGSCLLLFWKNEFEQFIINTCIVSEESRGCLYFKNMERNYYAPSPIDIDHSFVFTKTGKTYLCLEYQSKSREKDIIHIKNGVLLEQLIIRREENQDLELSISITITSDNRISHNLMFPAKSNNFLCEKLILQKAINLLPWKYFYIDIKNLFWAFISKQWLYIINFSSIKEEKAYFKAASSKSRNFNHIFISSCNDRREVYYFNFQHKKYLSFPFPEYLFSEIINEDIVFLNIDSEEKGKTTNFSVRLNEYQKNAPLTSFIYQENGEWILNKKNFKKIKIWHKDDRRLLEGYRNLGRGYGGLTENYADDRTHSFLKNLVNDIRFKKGDKCDYLVIEQDTYENSISEAEIVLGKKVVFLKIRDKWLLYARKVDESKSDRKYCVILEEIKDKNDLNSLNILSGKIKSSTNSLVYSDKVQTILKKIAISHNSHSCCNDREELEEMIGYYSITVFSNQALTREPYPVMDKISECFLVSKLIPVIFSFNSMKKNIDQNYPHDFRYNKNAASAIERVKKIHSSIDTKQAYLMYQHGFSSAYSIASVPKLTFIKKASIFCSNPYFLREIYENARHITAKINMDYLSYMQSSSPYVQTEQLKRHITCDYNYTKIFGGQNTFAYDETNTLLSPAAYFFDLMRVICDSDLFHVKEKNISLKKRRPDLFEIPLTGKYTDHKIYHLELLNSVLSRLLLENKEYGIIDFTQKMRYLSHATFEQLRNINSSLHPNLFFQPIDLFYEKIHSFMGMFSISFYKLLSQFHQCFLFERLSESESQIAKQDKISFSVLGLSMSEVEWMKNLHKASLGNLTQLFFENPTINLRYFSSQVGCPVAEVKKLIYQAGSGFKNYLNYKLPYRLKIIIDYDYREEEIVNFSEDHLKRIVFLKLISIKLSKKLYEIDELILYSLDLSGISADFLKKGEQSLFNLLNILAHIYSLNEEHGLSISTLRLFFQNQIADNLWGSTDHEFEYFTSAKLNKKFREILFLANEGESGDYKSMLFLISELSILLKIDSENVRFLIRQFSAKDNATLSDFLLICFRIVAISKHFLINITQLFLFSKANTIDLFSLFNKNLNSCYDFFRLLMQLSVTVKDFPFYHVMINPHPNNLSIFLNFIKQISNIKYSTPFYLQGNEEDRLKIIKSVIDLDEHLQTCLFEPIFKNYHIRECDFYDILFFYYSIGDEKFSSDEFDNDLFQNIRFLKKFAKLMTYFSSPQIRQGNSEISKLDVRREQGDKHYSSLIIYIYNIVSGFARLKLLDDPKSSLVEKAKPSVIIEFSLKLMKELSKKINPNRSENYHGFDMSTIMILKELKEISNYVQFSFHDVCYILLEKKSSIVEGINQLFGLKNQQTRNCQNSFSHDNNLFEKISFPSYEILSNFSYLKKIYFFDTIRQSLKLDVSQIHFLINIIEGYPVSSIQLSQFISTLESLHPNIQKNEKYVSTYLEMQRNALLDRAIIKIQSQLPEIKSATDLYHYLLIDPLVCGHYETSYILQGISSLQLLFTRCQQGYEKSIQCTIPTPWWNWIASYRIWEANRKVFLYPENYIDTTLRQEQSPEYSELSKELMQSRLSEDFIQTAFINYFKRIERLSQLIFCEAVSTDSCDELGSYKLIYLLARDCYEPVEYYLRQLTVYQNNPGKVIWDYWRKINGQINSDYVSATVFNNNLLIFWVEAKIHNKENSEKNLTYKIQCLRQKFGCWQPPQVIYEGSLLLELNININQIFYKNNTMYCPVNKEEEKKLMYYNKIQINVALDCISISYPFYPEDYPEEQMSDVIQFQLNSSLRLTKIFTIPTTKNEETIFSRMLHRLFGNQNSSDPSTLKLNQNNEKIFTVLKALTRNDHDNGNFIFLKTDNEYNNTVFMRIHEETYLLSSDIYFHDKNCKESMTITRVSSSQAINRMSSVLTGIDSNIMDLYHLLHEALEFDLLTLLPSNKPCDINCPMRVELDFSGGMGRYYWEIFFHIPFYIATRLTDEEKFESARTWFHYIFDPNDSMHQMKNSHYSNTMISCALRSLHNRVRLPTKGFRFPPFCRISPNVAYLGLLDKDLINVYHNQIFQPHTLAELRPVVYMKAIVMQYIKNLIAQGDSLFKDNQREAIEEARLYYTVAEQLLGPKPVLLGEKPNTPPMAMKDFIAGRFIYNPQVISIFEYLENKNLFQIEHAAIEEKLMDFNPYFGIPENQEFIEYWNIISDRLFKIRYSLDIEGNREYLDFFSPEIDPRQLVRAAATMSGGHTLKANLPQTPSLYRFSYLIQESEKVANLLVQMGDKLLAAMEKRDAKELTHFSIKQQFSISKEITRSKQWMIEVEEQTMLQIETQIAIAAARAAYYTGLTIDPSITGIEVAAKSLRYTSRALTTASNAMTLSASVARLAPDLGFPTAMTYGGSHVGAAMDISASFARSQAEDVLFMANELMDGARIIQRTRDYIFQATLARAEIVTLEKQLKVVDIRHKIAQQELLNHEKSIEQQEELNRFYKTQFTNLELYQWMVKEISKLFAQYHHLAFGLLELAHAAYLQELRPKKEIALSVLSNGLFSSRQGLLSGERLTLAIQELNQAYRKDDLHLQNLTKHFSLKSYLVGSNGTKWPTCLMEEGGCIFNINDLSTDYPSYELFTIKTLIVNVLGLRSNYETIDLILTQTATGNCSNTSREVVICDGKNDTGLFNTSNNCRYLPFEGNGLDGSSWILRCASNNPDKEKIERISDVIITFQFTARKALFQPSLGH